LTPANCALRTTLVRDWLKFPELRWLDRFAPGVAVFYGVVLYGFGELLQDWAPTLQTNGAQLIVWCFFISTVALYHATYSVNSLAHLYGSRRYATNDDSRNNALVALLTLGEGWHNNHHYYPASVRQGFFPHEIDPTFYVLTALNRLGLIWDLRGVPQHILDAASQPPQPVQADNTVRERYSRCEP
jgi:stearoyl-CoA desaturase (delta-9 desaturase)